METLETKTVAELVTENIRTAHVFKKYGIDFCCGGGISIQKAATKANADLDELTNDLLNCVNTTTRANDYNNWELDFLTDHIINIHHRYIDDSIPLVKQYGERVQKVHGHHYNELFEINELFNEVAGEMSAHCKKEELILFPYIKKMVKAGKSGGELPSANFGSVDNPIKMMESEHEEAGEIMKKIAVLSNDFTPPGGACNTYRAFYAKLQEFEEDLHQHIHLENNILFPKSLKLEKKMRA